MAGLDPAIHAFASASKDVDARHKAGHDAVVSKAPLTPPSTSPLAGEVDARSAAGEGASPSNESAVRTLTPPSHPRSGIPDLGIMHWPKSETSDFGNGRGSPPPPVTASPRKHPQVAHIVNQL